MSPHEFQHRLLAWFDQHGRHDLPWQQAITPYRVWVSEIMLQQTQVASVIAYYQRFMARFTDLHALAEADIDSVLQHWAGLGYYARARNLHKTAQSVMASGGCLPETIEGLCALPGIGRSTAGAILSIACGQRQPILDGNVKRVLSRFHAVEGWPGQPAVSAQLWQLAEQYTPEQRCADYTQAMMDLGATVCVRSKPACGACPVAEGCRARQQDAVSRFPQSKPRRELPTKRCYWLVVHDAEQRVLMEKRPSSGIWGGLWALPEFAEIDQIGVWLAERGWRGRQQTILIPARHRFSHFELEYTPVVVQLDHAIHEVMAGDRQVWYKPPQVQTLALPTPVQRLFDLLTL